MHRILTSSILAVAVAAVVAQAALAGGEPKNELPFTRPVPARVTQAVPRLSAERVRLATEQKNEGPFTRAVVSAHRQPAVRGESKNELPFTAAASADVPATPGPGSGFSWTDALLGVVLGVSLSAAAAGAALLARRRVPRTA